MHSYIPLSIPNLKGNELKYVTTAVETGWVSTGGPYVTEFENRVAKYVNSVGAVSCQNGTAGLHMALLLCGVMREEEVIVPTLTFIAAVNPVKYVGAEPVFMDCDDSLTMDPDALETFCSEECFLIDGVLTDKKTGKKIRAIVVVHVFGNMANMERIMGIAEQYSLKVVEDATEAIGTYYVDGLYQGRYAGTIGLVGVYSFNGNKIITTGGGGMIVSNDEGLLQHARHLTTQAKSDELYYTHDEIGYNYRMTNIQAALGLAQLEQLEQFIKVKQKNFNYYKEKISQVKGLTLLDFREHTRSNCWFYALLCTPDYPLKRDNIIKMFSEKGVQTRPVWGLIHEQKPYLDNRAYKIEKAKNYWSNIVNIPCSTDLNFADIDYVVECLRAVR